MVDETTQETCVCVGGLAYKSKLGREDPKKVKHDLDSLYALCGETHCAVSSSFVCSADFLMRGFWRRMTERSACSVGEEGHLKEMSNALSMDTPNTRFPPAQMPCWQLGSTIRTEKGGISLKLSLCEIH